jgi:hypothetical protein
VQFTPRKIIALLNRRTSKAITKIYGLRRCYPSALTCGVVIGMPTGSWAE